MSSLGLLAVLFAVLLIVFWVLRGGYDRITNAIVAIHLLIVLILVVHIAQLLGVAWPAVSLWIR